MDLDAVTWPAERLGDALELLATEGGLAPRAVAAPRASGDALVESRALETWIEQAASYLGVEAEPITVLYREVSDLLRGASPALVRLPGEGAPRFVALVGRAGRDLLVLSLDGSRVRVPAQTITDILCRPFEARASSEIARMLDAAQVAPRRRARVHRAMLSARLGPAVIRGVWILRSLPGASPRRQFTEARLPGRMLAVVAAQVATSGLLALAWWTIAQGVLDDQLDHGWILAWALLLLTAVPVRLIGAWSAGVFAIDAGGLLKRRLLAGALALEPQEVRHEGAGGFLGRVIESSAVEALALGAGVAGISGVISLLLAAVVLAGGAAGALHIALLLAWMVVSVTLVVRHHRRRRDWTDARFRMTNELVERMNGYRTRLAQEPRERWHDDEDQALARYLAESEGLDRTLGTLTAMVPRGWLFLGMLGLVPAFVTGTATPTSFAVSLAGVLLARAALNGLAGALTNLSGALIAWRRVGLLFDAAARGGDVPAPLASAPAPGAARAILDAHEIVFRHGDRGVPVLRGASLRIASGDRLLLEGSSGAGKSTLGSLLAGLRTPESGLLLLDGLDRRSLGTAAWRRRVASAPQFHENHVLQSTFAFNLLMGRRWPPRPEDVAEAETICRELGLGELLARMPAGLMQMVGETGWQLSHGEKSRLYIARALLQGAEVLLLDESFGALDPETLGKALRCVLERAPTMLVIAHP
jgi:ATP-binding cassette subfamily B protein